MNRKLYLSLIFLTFLHTTVAFLYISYIGFEKKLFDENESIYAKTVQKSNKEISYTVYHDRYESYEKNKNNFFELYRDYNIKIKESKNIATADFIFMDTNNIEKYLNNENFDILSFISSNQSYILLVKKDIKHKYYANYLIKKLNNLFTNTYVFNTFYQKLKNKSLEKYLIQENISFKPEQLGTTQYFNEDSPVFYKEKETFSYVRFGFMILFSFIAIIILIVVLEKQYKDNEVYNRDSLELIINIDGLFLFILYSVILYVLSPF